MRRQSYTELRPARICETIKLLARRMEERFHDSGLGRVANELGMIADEDQRALEHVQRPLWWVRGFTVFTFVVLAALVLWAGRQLLHVVGVGGSPAPQRRSRYTSSTQRQ